MSDTNQAGLTGPEDFVSLLRAVGVTPGDTILVHSDSTMILAMTGATNWKDALEYQLAALRCSVGPQGTLVVPTFTYAFCTGTPYVHERTRSEVGIFSNYVLAQPDAVRSFHPIFSFAAIGARANEICGEVSNSSFGRGSVFEWLHHNDASVVCINIPFELSCTFVHHVEEIHGVDYRYIKIFEGEMSRLGEVRVGTVEYFVRDLDRHLIPQLEPLAHRLTRSALINQVIGPSGIVSRTRCVDIYRQLWDMLDEDPYCLVQMEPVSADDVQT